MCEKMVVQFDANKHHRFSCVLQSLPGVVPKGDRQGYSLPLGNLSPLVGEKLTVSRGISTDDNPFIYIINYEYLLLIYLRQIIDLSSCLI